MYKYYRGGFIEVICGPMFASKTETLLSRYNSLKYANKQILTFKPKIDNRYSERDIVSHSGISIPCKAVSGSEELLNIIVSNQIRVDVVIIDEVQFFDDGIIEVAESLANMGIRVIVAGLDLDYNGVPFPIMANLIARAEMVTKLTAVCTVCGDAATRSQRLTDETEVVSVGADSYEARCREHHEVNYESNK